MALTPDCGESLLDAAKAGWMYALGELLERHRALLINQARQLLRAFVRAKVEEVDLAQEVFVIALQKVADFKGSSENQFAGWLSSILRRRAKDLRPGYWSNAQFLHLQASG